MDLAASSCVEVLGGEVEDTGFFGFVRVLQPGGSKQRRKLNMALRVLLVISYFFGVLFVRGGIYCAPF